MRFQEILDICGVLNVNAHELPVTPTPTQVMILKKLKLLILINPWWYVYILTYI